MELFLPFGGCKIEIEAFGDPLRDLEPGYSSQRLFASPIEISPLCVYRLRVHTYIHALWGVSTPWIAYKIFYHWNRSRNRTCFKFLRITPPNWPRSPLFLSSPFCLFSLTLTSVKTPQFFRITSLVFSKLAAVVLSLLLISFMCNNVLIMFNIVINYV